MFNCVIKVAQTPIYSGFFGVSKKLKKIFKKMKKSVDKWKRLWYYNRAPLREGLLEGLKKLQTNLEN